MSDWFKMPDYIGMIEFAHERHRILMQKVMARWNYQRDVRRGLIVHVREDLQ